MFCQENEGRRRKFVSGSLAKSVSHVLVQASLVQHSAVQASLIKYVNILCCAVLCSVVDAHLS